jgi:O-antigen/teichoic acid export membrane protein
MSEPESVAHVDDERLSAGDIKDRASRGVVTMGLRGVATRALGLVGNIVLARMLVPSDFGALAFGFSIIVFATVLSSGGLGASLVRRPAPPTRRDLESIFGFQLTVMVAALAVIALVGAFTGRAGALATIMAISLPIDAFRVPGAVMAERALAFGVIARAEVLEIMAYNVAAIAAVLLGFGVWGVAAAAIVRAAAGSVSLVRYRGIGIVRPRLSAAFLHENGRFGLSFQSVSIVALVRDQGFNVVVAAVGGLAMLGYWAIATRLLQALVLLFESLWRVAYPAMARLAEIDGDAEAVLDRSLRLAALAAGAIVVVLSGTAPALVATLFGAAWDESAAILPLAGLGALIAGPTSACVTGYLSAAGEVGAIVRAASAQTIVLLGAGILLLHLFGALGLGITWLLGSIVYWVILSRAVQRVAAVSIARATWRSTLLACLACLPAYAVASSVTPAPLALAGAIAVGETLYLGASFVVCRPQLSHISRLAWRAVPARGLAGRSAA